VRRARLRHGLVCALVLVLAAVALPAQAADTVHAPAERADLSWAMLTLGGERITLERFRGRVLIVNSFATWCEPCVAELASLQALHATMNDTALVVAVVAPQSRAPVAGFVRRRKVTIPVYLEATPAPAVYRFEAVPTTWVIARDGRIAIRQRGAIRWDTPAVRRRIEALLAEPVAH
jgi:thiol-disulfide isomerase/thioredoxin